MLYRHELGPPSFVSPRDRDVLLLHSASGDQTAFADFYDEFAPMLVALVHHTVDDLHQVYPIVFDIFVTLWRDAGSFDPEQQSATLWAVTKALRTCLRYRVSSERAADGAARVI